MQSTAYTQRCSSTQSSKHNNVQGKKKKRKPASNWNPARLWFFGKNALSKAKNKQPTWKQRKNLNQLSMCVVFVYEIKDTILLIFYTSDIASTANVPHSSRLQSTHTPDLPFTPKHSSILPTPPGRPCVPISSRCVLCLPPCLLVVCPNGRWNEWL